MATTVTGRTCPNCSAAVPAGRSLCPVCKLQVSKMDAFIAARAAAESRGFRSTKVEDGRAPVYLRPGPIALVLLMILAGAGVVWYMQKPPPPPAWSKYATSREAAVRELMELVATGQDDAYLKAYRRLDPAMYDKTRDDEKGLYRQLYHVMYLYLSGEFGDAWIHGTKYEQDPADPDTIIVRAGLETLHVRTALMTPPEEAAKGEREHFAVRSVDEFPIDQAKGFQSTAGQMAVIGMVGGPAAVENMQTILGATITQRRETPMQKKVRLMPILRNPRETFYRTLLQAYPLREDPVMRARLQAIRGDERYEPQARDGAEQLISNTVPAEVLDGMGIQD